MAVAEAKNDKRVDLFAVRSLLFLPASNPRAIAKARDLRPDMVVLDLEDAVRPQDKAAAREAAVHAVAADWPTLVAIRVNGVGSEWHLLDLDAVARSKADFVVVPRAVSAHLVHELAETADIPVMAMIETAAGVIAAAEIAKECAGLIAGTNDLRSDLGLPFAVDRGSISASLQWIVLAARSAGIAVFDGVFNRLNDPAGFAREAIEGKNLGFDGKSLIHPDQIRPCHEAFAPAEGDLERARRLIEAFDGGAQRFEDEMIERMHVEAARRLLDRAAL